MKIDSKSTGIKIDKHVGTWYVIDSGDYHETPVFLLEHETHGDNTFCLIVNESGAIVMDDVSNGLSELEDKPTFDETQVGEGDTILVRKDFGRGETVRGKIYNTGYHHGHPVVDYKDSMSQSWWAYLHQIDEVIEA